MQNLTENQRSVGRTAEFSNNPQKQVKKLQSNGTNGERVCHVLYESNNELCVSGEAWKWSNGASSDYRKWTGGSDPGPVLGSDSCVVVWSESKTMSVQSCSEAFPFLCFKDDVVLLEEKMSWEQALEACGNISSKHRLLKATTAELDIVFGEIKEIINGSIKATPMGGAMRQKVHLGRAEEESSRAGERHKTPMARAVTPPPTKRGPIDPDDTATYLQWYGGPGTRGPPPCRPGLSIARCIGSTFKKCLTGEEQEDNITWTEKAETARRGTLAQTLTSRRQPRTFSGTVAPGLRVHHRAVPDLAKHGEKNSSRMDENLEAAGLEKKEPSANRVHTKYFHA
ncbi:hypothetical protein WMY93_012598 [Mugilogobius chulae]|uniref:C-type lectin domain-containing protein n=1 Tax=Mugilogobius chulae TaxID=88201 RepID=A0AAW0P1P2_9GOBI